MSRNILLLIALSILIFSGCIGSNNSFDLSSATYKNIDMGDTHYGSYTLSFYLPKDTSLGNYKHVDNSKEGYYMAGIYLSNNLGKTTFQVYELTKGQKSREYFFGREEDTFKSDALEEWNKRKLSSMGYDRDFKTATSTYMKEINGVKESRVIRTVAKDQRGNQMIAESCWFNYPNSFWTVTTTWPENYYNEWWGSDIIFHYEH